MRRKCVNIISTNLIKSKITKIKFPKTAPLSDNQYSLDDRDIKDLADARDLVMQTESMLKAKLEILQKNINLVSIAKNKISKILYKLTGNKFYKLEEGGN